MGFSVLGLLVALAVLVPNLLLVWLPPRDGLPVVRVPALVSGVERAGQGLCLVVPAISEPGVLNWWWAVPVTVGLAGYYLLWRRYLVTGRVSAALYRPLWGIPVPMAILPVLVFLSAGVWLSNIWIAASAMVLAAGHIPASVIIARSVAARR